MQTTSLDKLLKRQGAALERAIRPDEILRQVLRRRAGGGINREWECVRRLSPPNRYRDDVSVDGVWRFSEAFDGTRAWYLEKGFSAPKEATGRALAAQRWAGTLLDHLRPLAQLRRLGCVLEDGGAMPTARGDTFPTVRISMPDDFAETVFIDEHGRIAAHHMDLPPAGEDERELEVCVDEWAQCDGLVHPVRSTILDRHTGATVAEIVVSAVTRETLARHVFDLGAD